MEGHFGPCPGTRLDIQGARSAVLQVVLGGAGLGSHTPPEI